MMWLSLKLSCLIVFIVICTDNYWKVVRQRASPWDRIPRGPVIVNRKIDTRGSEELTNQSVTIRETKTGRCATRKTRWYTRTKTVQYAMKGTRQYATKRTIRCTTTILKKWALGANNRATLIFFTNPEISPATHSSVCGREAWFF